MIWRGPMLNKALTQFLGDVLWGDLDYLFIDLPPGTGDTQISLIQNAKVDGAIIVSTPQDVAFLDARKAIGLFQTVKVPIAGIIENMSSFHLPRLPHRDAHLRPRRGEGRRQAHGPALPGRDPHRPGHPRGQRRRRAHGGGTPATAPSRRRSSRWPGPCAARCRRRPDETPYASLPPACTASSQTGTRPMSPSSPR